MKGSKTTIKEAAENEPGFFNYITTQNTNNGCMLKTNIKTEKEHCLTIDSATIGAVFYQDKSFCASDHVEIVRSKLNISKLCYLFLASIFKMEQYRYGYGRKWNQTNIKKTLLKLPSTKENTPDWDFMENFIASLPYSKYL